MNWNERLSVWKDKIKGWKVIIVGAVLAVLPLLIDPLTAIVGMDLHFVAGDNAETISAWLGLALVILRFVISSGAAGNATRVEG